MLETLLKGNCSKRLTIVDTLLIDFSFVIIFTTYCHHLRFISSFISSMYGCVLSAEFYTLNWTEVLNWNPRPIYGGGTKGVDVKHSAPADSQQQNKTAQKNHQPSDGLRSQKPHLSALIVHCSQAWSPRCYYLGLHDPGLRSDPADELSLERSPDHQPLSLPLCVSLHRVIGWPLGSAIWVHLTDVCLCASAKYHAVQTVIWLCTVMGTNYLLSSYNYLVTTCVRK